MDKKVVIVAIAIAAFAISAAAQVTGSGTTNVVPVFTGGSTIGNSDIWSLPNGNVGIGNSNPTAPLTVNSGNYAVEIGVSPGSTPNPGLRSDGAGDLDITSGSGGALSFGYYNSTRYTFWGAWTNRAPSLAYNSASSFLFNAAGVELAEGIDVNGPYSFWMQTRNSSGGAQALTINPLGGNVGIGTTNPLKKLHIAGDVEIDGSLYFGSNATAQSAAYSGNCGADYAESVGVSGDRTKYAPGDILVIDPDAPGSFLKSNQPYSTMVAGVYSTQPGFVGRKHPAGDAASANEVPMAMVGRVPTKVSAENGPIKVGDLLVASSTMGYAMKGTDRSKMLGAVVGKALGNLDSGTGVIEVLVTLQ